MEPIHTLFERKQDCAEPLLPPDLRDLYGGDLYFPSALAERPYIIGNFVSTLDGIVSFDIPGQSGGGQISGSNPGDRFIMGLLRASADAVIAGAATLNAAPTSELWTAESINPDAKHAYSRYRRDILKKPAHPLIVIVTGRGHVDLNHSVFHMGGINVLVITTPTGRDRLLRAGADRLPSTQIRQLPGIDAHVDAPQIASILKREFGVDLLLHEGGPKLFGTFLTAGLVDELFLTIAPQIAGRSAEDERPGVAAGVRFVPDTAPWLALISAKRQSSHLYLRYGHRK